MKIRDYCLDLDTGWLEIQDCLENKSLFEGNAGLDEEGNPANSEYYEMLLWDDLSLSRPWNLEKQFRLPVWVGAKTEETSGTDSFDNPGHTQEYKDRQELLEEFGFADGKPMYQYFDRYGNLQLELYMDEEEENVCGIVRQYRFNSELEKLEFMYGFTQYMLPEAEWEERNKYLLKNINGYDGSEYEDWIKDYESKTEYREDGRPDYFESTGRIDEHQERNVLVSINFVYREDGTLYYRDYDHNTLAFETTLSYLDSYYDEKERVVYENGYITHGYVEYYYIYEDESDKPTYCLYLDHNLGYAIPEMVKYR